QPQHRLGDVDPGDLATRPDRGGERQGRRAGAAADIENALPRRGADFREEELADLDVARLLDFGAADPARPGDLVPILPHRGIGGFSLLAHFPGLPLRRLRRLTLTERPSLPRRGERAG